MGMEGRGVLEQGPQPVRRAPFVDESVNQALADQGFAVLPRPLTLDVVRDLAALHRAVVDEAGADSSGRFLPTMTFRRPDLRARLWDGVRDLLSLSIDPLLSAGTAELVGGSFVSKPGSPHSARFPHQDPTIFDERRHLSLSLWVPLSNSVVSNGTLHVLAGSHRMGNHVRPPDVDSFDVEVRTIALRDSVALELDAGQVVAIDGAVIHHSPPNESGEERVAAIGALRPTEARMHYVCSEGGATRGTARLFDVGAEMYRSGDLLTPGVGDAPEVGQVPYWPATVADLRRSQSTR